MGIEIERRFLVDGRYEKPWREITRNKPILSEKCKEDDEITWNGTHERRTSFDQHYNLEDSV